MFFAFSLITHQLYSQCTDFAAGQPFNNLNTAFGGAPCDDGTGCAFLEFTGFEVFASESYFVDGFVEGGEYAFSICNGPSAGSWIPDFTIIAPSGAVDAFGPGDGDGCTISWVASETGTYVIGINEEGSCGGGQNLGTDNGLPALTCLNGTPCPVAPNCNAGTLANAGLVPICDPNGLFDIIIENSEPPKGGGFGFIAQNFLGGTGGGPPGDDGEIALLLNGPSFKAVDASFNGVLAESLSGPWVIKGLVLDANNDICGVTSDSLIVGFGTESPIVTDITTNGVDELTVFATGGLEPYSYLWSDGQTTQTAGGLMPDVAHTVTVSDLNGCSVEQEFLFTVSTNSISSLNELNISPNPNTGFFSVQLSFDRSEFVEVEVLDLTGKLIQNTKEELTSGQIDFDLNDSAAGVYFVRIIAGAESITQRIIVN